MNQAIQSSDTQFLLFETADGSIRVETRMQDESIWLTINQLSELFGVDKSGISRHLKNIYESGEFDKNAVVAVFATTASDGKTYQVEYFNLDAIISVGYRVNSLRGTQFRIWASQRLREYIIKGFTMDDERLKKAGGGSCFLTNYWPEFEISAPPKKFSGRKILDIYATSIDYNGKAETSRAFFKIIQNKMHWAAHGHTAAEVIYHRADAAKPNMGMTNWVGTTIRKNEAEIAKNYLNNEELDLLDQIVTMYLEFAEMQALQQKPMTMNDWIKKLDDFLKVSDRDLLSHSGKITHENALKKAHEEYEKFHRNELAQPTEVEKHFIQAEAEWKKAESILK